MDLKPATHVIIQFEGGFYKIPVTAEVGFALVPGSGVGHLVVDGATFMMPIANPAARTMTENTAASDLAAALLAPVTAAHAGDDLSKVIAAAGPSGFIDLAPGDYPAFTVPGA